MQIQVTVTHTLAPEVLELFKGLFKEQPAKVKRENPLKNSDSQPAPAVPATPQSSEATEEVTIEQVRAAVQEKSQAGKRDAVKALLTKFGAANVTTLKKDQYADFLTQLNAA